MSDRMSGRDRSPNERAPVPEVLSNFATLYGYELLPADDRYDEQLHVWGQYVMLYKYDTVKKYVIHASHYRIDVPDPSLHTELMWLMGFNAF